jgi:anaerobic magnesium-protoporphyrin IX monomethyl ester cyclase
MILLVQPFSREQGKHIHPPISLMAVAALPDKYGHKVKIIDGNIESEAEIKRKIKQYSPDFIGFTTFTGPILKYVYDLSLYAKQNTKAKVIWGGIHASIAPDETIALDCVDIVVVNEGDSTLLDIIENKDDLEKVKGIIYKKGKKVMKTESRGQLQDLSGMLPLPWHLIDVEKYILPWAGAKRTLPVLTSKGCPFACTFCYNLLFNSQRWRPFPLSWIKDEIDFLVEKHHLDGVRLDASDNFLGTDPGHAMQIAKYMGKKKLRWAAQLRLAQITPEMLKAFKDTGLQYVFYGIESGSPRILKSIRKDPNIDHIKRMVGFTNRLKIYAAAGFMYDFPTETLEDFNMTLRLIKDLNILTRYSALQPYPGTPIYDQIKKSSKVKLPDDIQGWSEFEYTKPHGFSDIPNIKEMAAQLNFRYNYAHNLQVCLRRGNYFMLGAMGKSFAEYYVNKIRNR